LESERKKQRSERSEVEVGMEVVVNVRRSKAVSTVAKPTLAVLEK
jgi:hypothetical protein